MIAEPIVQQDDEDVVARAEAVLVAAVFDEIVSNLRCALDVVDRPAGTDDDAALPPPPVRAVPGRPTEPVQVPIRSPPSNRWE